MGWRTVGLVLATGMLGLGALVTAFALGWIGGTAMEGTRTYATLGPLFAGLGIALLVVMLQNRPR